MSDFHSFRSVKARKVHHCEHCRKPIAIGQFHSSFAGVVDGDFTTYREHIECRAVWEELFRLRGCCYGDEAPFLHDDELDEDREWITADHPVVAERLWGAP